MPTVYGSDIEELSRQFTRLQGLRNGEHDTCLNYLLANFMPLC